jgi:hypothetical protein
VDIDPLTTLIVYHTASILVLIMVWIVYGISDDEVHHYLASLSSSFDLGFKYIRGQKLPPDLLFTSAHFSRGGLK